MFEERLPRPGQVRSSCFSVMIVTSLTRLSTGEGLQTFLKKKSLRELIKIYFGSDLDTIVRRFLLCDRHKVARPVMVERQNADMNETYRTILSQEGQSGREEA